MKFCGGYVSVRYNRAFSVVRRTVLIFEKVSKQAEFYIA